MDYGPLFHHVAKKLSHAVNPSTSTNTFQNTPTYRSVSIVLRVMENSAYFN